MNNIVINENGISLSVEPGNTLDNLVSSFQQAVAQLTLQGSVEITNGEVEQIGSQLRIRRFSEDYYAISGYQMPDPSNSPVARKLAEIQRHPPEEFLGSGVTNLIFQHGNRKDVGFNGITVEALLMICKDRLEQFQQGQYACIENARAIECIEQTLDALNARVERRLREGAYDTQQAEAKVTLRLLPLDGESEDVFDYTVAANQLVDTVNGKVEVSTLGHGDRIYLGPKHRLYEVL